jgi:hypothetical protein
MLVVLMTVHCCSVQIESWSLPSPGQLSRPLRSKICSRFVSDDNLYEGGRLTMREHGLCFSCTTQVCSCCLLVGACDGINACCVAARCTVDGAAFASMAVNGALLAVVSLERLCSAVGGVHKTTTKVA